MRRALVLFILLVVLCGVMKVTNDKFFSAYNLKNTLRQISMLGIFAIGVGMVIITGGIDLSVGSIIGLTGLLLAMFLRQFEFPVFLGILLVVGLGLLLGLIQGLFVAKARLQPFIVTLCGLLIYRGTGRFITKDMTQGFGNGFEGLKWLANGTIVNLPMPGEDALEVPVPFLILIIVAIFASIFLHKSVYGRHLYALGRNEEAALYSGIKTDRLKILAYVMSAGLAGVAGIIYALYTNTIQPASAGNTYELYAIAACVLGGCSLRGGEGTVLGIILGAAVIPFLRNFVSLAGLTDLLEYAIIGMVILITVTTDELFKARSERRAAKRA